MAPSLEHIARILYDEETIQNRVTILARQINEDYKGKELIILTVMKGGDNFSTNIRRAMYREAVMKYGDIVVDVIPDIAIISLFNDPRNPQSEPHTILGIDHKIPYEERDVLIVEDIIDRGITMKYILAEVQKRNPSSLKLCALLSKEAKREVNIEISYLGFNVEDAFVIGYGMDFNHRYRDLPFIGVLKPEIYQK